MNIKFSGEVDTKAIYTELENADTKTEEAAIWNKNYQLIVFYADSKKKIAGSEFYVDIVPYSDWDCHGVDTDGDGWEDDYICDEIPSEREELDVRIVFPDGSKADLATYTDVGFSDLEDELNEFVESFE
jgi:hypothetical protein